MAFAFPGSGALDYYPCRYGGSKLMFRGPQRDLDGPYCAVLGGTETYGKFLPRPWPVLAEAQTGRRMVNLGLVNAGPDVYLAEPEVIAIASRAQVTVVQVMGAANLTNAYYAVHPRRNDRFLRAENSLRQVYPGVDFTEFHFTRHLLMSLHDAAPDRFAAIAADLRQTWIARMRSLLTRIDSPTILLWMGDRPPPPPGQAGLARDPVLVDAAMVHAVRPHATAYLEVVFSDRARTEGVAAKSFAELERTAAEEVPGPLAHREVADALAQAMRQLF